MSWPHLFYFLLFPKFPECLTYVIVHSRCLLNKSTRKHPPSMLLHITVWAGGKDQGIRNTVTNVEAGWRAFTSQLRIKVTTYRSDSEKSLRSPWFSVHQGSAIRLTWVLLGPPLCSPGVSAHCSTVFCFACHPCFISSLIVLLSVTHLIVSLSFLVYLGHVLSNDVCPPLRRCATCC